MKKKSIWEQAIENGKKRSPMDVLYGDCFEQLGEHEQDQVIEDIINKPKKKKNEPAN